jgi:hypothetical protein
METVGRSRSERPKFMTPANPLTTKQRPQPPGSAGTNAVDLMLGGLPAAQTGGQQMALGAMLGPRNNLAPYLQLGGPEYAEQLDALEWNPLAAWG